MALHLFLGNSGAGKSDRLYTSVLEEAKAHPRRTYYVLVPEQFTMATQRAFVSRQENRAILNVDVLSFKRLSYRIFEELGKDTRSVLEDTGKNLILRRLLARLLPKLQVLQGSLHKIGYIDEIKSFLTELMQYRIEPEALSRMAQAPGVSPYFAAKLADLEILYRAFSEEIAGDYMPAEQLVEYAASLVPHSEMFQDAVLVFDGFTGFTPVQQVFLEAVFAKARDIYVALTIDAIEDFFGENDVEQLFFLSKKTIRTLLAIAERTGVAVERPVVFAEGDKARFKTAPLLYHLEQNLFRSNPHAYEYDGDISTQEQLQLYGFATPAEELHFAACEIKRLTAQGYHYRDIAIVSGDVELYASYVPQIFSEYDLPYFLDQTSPILFHPLLECVRGLLELARAKAYGQDLSYEHMMRVIKSGALPIEAHMAHMLENYVLESGIRGENKWKKEWKYRQEWLTEEQLEQLNTVRDGLMEVLKPFLSGMRSETATVEERTRTLLNVMLAWKLSEVDEEGRIWRILMDLFDKLVTLLGDEVLELEEYVDVLLAGFEGVTVASIPPRADQVVVGDIERTRLDEIKVLFFLGVNDGVIPRVANDGGILSQMERQLLSQAQFELAPTARERAFMQRFYLYLNLTKPSERLYVTFAGRSADGSSRKKSYLIGMLCHLFAGLTIKEADYSSEQLWQLATPQASLRLLSQGLEDAKKGEASRIWRTLFAWYMRHDSWQERIEALLSASFFRFEVRNLPPELGHQLYGSILEGSVTRLEQFAGCAYAHFLKYGLGLSKRKEYGFEALDFGEVMHAMLEKYATELSKSGYDWFDVTQEVQRGLCDAAASSVFSGERFNVLTATAKNKYLMTRMEHLLKQTVETLTQQVRKGRFTPAAVEVAFGMDRHRELSEFILSETQRMYLKGRIDRIDLCDEGEDTYVKIIDYKTGQTKFSLIDIYHGLQLQLVVYLNAAMELIKARSHKGQVIPAGIFYYHVDEPVITTEGVITEEKLKKTVLEQLKPEGIVNLDKQVYTAMDTTFAGKSDVIPLAFTKDGKVARGSHAYDDAQLQTIRDYVNATIVDLGRRMLSGEIAPAPYQLDKEVACNFCEYRGICGFDKHLASCKYRVLLNIKSEDEILERMQQKLENNKEES